jgi:hypothetical protein
MQEADTSNTASQSYDSGRQNRPDASYSNIAGQTLEQLTELAALSWSVSSLYVEQIKLTGQTAKAELQLSGRSLAIAAALVVCFGVGLILLWSGMLLLLGYVILQLTASLSLTVLVMLLLQVSLLFWCWRSLSYVLSQVGFNETWQQLRRVLKNNTAQPAASKHGDTNAD